MRSLLVVAILGLSVTLTTAVCLSHPSTVIAAAPYTKNAVRFWGAPVYASTVNGHSIGSADISENIGYRMTLALSWRNFVPLADILDFIPGAGIGKRVVEIFFGNLPSPEARQNRLREAAAATRKAAADRQLLRTTLDALNTLNEDVDSILENLEDFDRRLNGIEEITQDNREQIHGLIEQVQMSDQRLATLQEDLDTIAKAALLALGVNTFLLSVVLASVWRLHRKIDRGFTVVVGLLRELVSRLPGGGGPRPNPPNAPPDPSPKPDDSDEFSVSFHAPREFAEGALLGGRYTLEHRLRRDNYGVTYLARDVSTGRRVAIRQFLPDQYATQWSTNPTHYRQAVQCFKNDARKLAALDTDFVASISDVFDHSNTACMVMPLSVESTLAARLTDEGPLPATLACQILKDLMDGLESLHAKQLVHGNISPTSVLLTERGEATLPVLIDFGVLRSDENDAREEPGSSADISALGATMYEAATGHPPDSASGATSPRAANALVSEWFDLAIREALSGAAGPQSVTEWRERLLPSPPPPALPPSKWPLLAGVGAAVAVPLSIWLAIQIVTPPKTIATEQSIWESIKVTTDPRRVDNFLAEWPDGPFREDAEELLASLLTREWESIKVTTDPRRVDNFLAEWPDGPFREDAEELLASLLTREWESIKVTTDPRRVDNFLAEWPDGPFREDAEELLARLRVMPELPEARSSLESLRVMLDLPEARSSLARLRVMPDLPELRSSLARLRIMPDLPELRSSLARLRVMPELPEMRSALESLRVMPELSGASSTLERLRVTPELLDVDGIVGELPAVPVDLIDGEDTGGMGANVDSSSTPLSPSSCDQLMLRVEFELRLDLAPVPRPIESSVPNASPDPRHGMVLCELERRLRIVVRDHLSSFIGPDWVRQRVPEDVRERWHKRQDEERADGRPVHDLIEYADFMDLPKIIAQSDNWRDVFQSIFHDRSEVAATFRRLNPIRKALAHSRPLSRTDVLTLTAETSRILGRLRIQVLH